MNRRALLLDAIERLAVVVLYGALVARIVAGIRVDSVGLGNLLLLPSEGLVLVFVLVRRRTNDVSWRMRDWLLALAATSAPMLVEARPGHGLVPPFAGAVVIVTGMLVQLHAKLVLGRSFGCIPANRGLKTAGPYRFVRHPMYAGYALSHLGYAMMNPTWWNVALYAMAATLQLARLLAEERLLERDVAYRRYRELVRHRLLPGLF